MKRIFTLVKYDYLQRIRSYRFLIILCCSLAFAFLLIPASDATYSTISIGEYLGHYNTAWIAYVTAMMSSVFISLFGYYLINNSILTDQNTKMGQLVAATDITNFQYLAAKFLGNFLILLSILICIFFVAIGQFFIHSSGYSFELSHYLTAYLLIPLPSIILIASLGIFLEVVFKKKSVLQNTVFFIFFGILLTQGWMGINGDAFGTRYPTQEMERMVAEVSGSTERPSVNIGFVIRQRTLEERFEFGGIPITSTFLLSRLIWPGLGLLMVFFASKIFHRFELGDKPISSKVPFNEPSDVPSNFGLEAIDLSSMPVLEKAFGIGPVFKAEFLMMVRKGKKWMWGLNIIGMVLLAMLPLDIAHKIVLPILWFLQVHRWADLVTKEKASQMHYFIYSSFRPVQRLLTSQYLAGVSLAVLLALPLVVRYIILGEWLVILAILCGAVFIIGLSAFLGITTGGKRLYEILFFFIAYLNVNEMPFTDYFGGVYSGGAYLGSLFGVTVVLVLGSYFFRGRQVGG